MILSRLLGAASLAALATAAAAQDGSLTILDYPGFEEPSFHPAYGEAHGEPTYSFFGDEEEAFQKLRAGFQADITHICAGSVTKWTESGLIEPWDTSRIEAWDTLDQNLTGQQVGGETEEVYFIPTDFGSTAIAYNPDEVVEEDVASLEVFKNPKYAGRMALPDNVDDAYALAYLATGTTDWTEAGEAEFEAASNWLREVHPNLRTYWTDPAELSQLMATGEVLVSWAWNETYPTMVEEGRPIGFQRETAEGSSLWLCGYVNMKDAPGDEDLAYDYVNAMLAPEAAMPLLEAGFGSANAAALGEIDEATLTASGLEQIEVPVLAQLPISNALREQHAETFEMIKSGF
ncbi:spermidine/putrescine transport system substrate-binding protein [Limimaricola soesokkakensis]|uniref:Spermidine/putrescine transport system substrate-binding protein n=1 Tax=Limimaricola soesokkakensis TaxID=1343159 RepID=A0A1X6YYY2_9RHOB|nr:ABC transporter substrate-binding protein [Limimaricola soesokkakensis]PSK87886.1 spermidine/putrescine transport system substrate-binding protein [Limimaricola soesokkakensis]SLN35479.1 Spermidine/putrescine-binding periplasmic protein precursor [Limimaricola soesokkakensis]